MRKIFVFILILLNLTSYADEKKALKHLEKKEFEKVVETLDKDIQKDTLNPGIYFIYSLLYNDPQYDKNNLDTSYYYILKAMDLYPPKEEKDREKLDKLYITDSTITFQKEKLDLQSYERAKSIHTLEAYNYYIHNFNLSIYLPDAISDRNELAYE